VNLPGQLCAHVILTEARALQRAEGSAVALLSVDMRLKFLRPKPRVSSTATPGCAGERAAAAATRAEAGVPNARLTGWQAGAAPKILDTSKLWLYPSSVNLLAFDSQSRKVVAFLGLVFLFSSIPYYIILHSGHVQAGRNLVIGLFMWCPALAALVTCAIFRIDLASLGWKWGPTRYVAWGYVIPILYTMPVYVAAWLFVPQSFWFSSFAVGWGGYLGFPGSPRTATAVLGLPLLATVGVLGSLAYALGEEIGWRGFLLPRLVSRFGFTAGCLLSGCIWAIWHYPLWMFSDYNSGNKDARALACFTVLVIGLAYVTGWLRLKSNSLWPAVIVHGSQNLFMQGIFDPMTSSGAGFLTGESGFGLALTVAVTAFYFWLRRKSVEPSPAVHIDKREGVASGKVYVLALIIPLASVAIVTCTYLMSKDRSAYVDGVVWKDEQPFQGATVTLVPDPPYRWVRLLFHFTTTDQHGHFVVPGVLPGDYKVFAWQRIKRDAFASSKFLQPYENLGTSVHIAEGSYNSLQIDLIPDKDSKQ
jgi:membrane protease YdiL (CAAX protease family)